MNSKQANIIDSYIGGLSKSKDTTLVLIHELETTYWTNIYDVTSVYVSFLKLEEMITKSG
jgi:hypothetical protein